MQNGSESSTGKDALCSEERTLPAGEQGRPERRSSRKLLVAGCILILGLMLIACVGLAVGVFAAAGITAAQNQDEWLALADDFMQAMADEEIDRAYLLFVNPADQGFKAELASFVDGPFFALFDGYESLAIDGWTFNYTNPEGLTVEITGPVFYQGEFEGVHQFALVKENGKWKLLAFNVVVPPEKINSYPASSN